MDAAFHGGIQAIPYHILVSEVMLQQTQVDRVLPKYREWLEKYPSLEALASAPEDDVTATWRPLGYNIRPRRLHAIARESVMRYGGQLPSDEVDAAFVQGNRGLHGRRHPELRVPPARRHPRHQRGARALPRVRRPRHSERHCNPKTPLGGVGGPCSAQRCLRLQPGVDGSRRPRVRCPETEMPGVPDEENVHIVPLERWGLSQLPTH